MLERRDARGRWVAQWRGALLNEVAPVDALVDDFGRYFVTFDDWGDRGTGSNVVAIYNGAGLAIRSLALTDLVPLNYIEALPHTHFSIWWTEGGHKISADGERLLLAVGIPSTGEGISTAGHFTLPITLATGAPAPGGRQWDAAMAAAAAARTAMQERRAAYRAFMTQPLTAPRSPDREAWDAYLDEAVKRLATSWELGNAWNMLVRPAGSPPFEAAFSPDPHTIFSQRNLPTVIAVASPEGVPLATALAPLVTPRRAGWLRGIFLYIVADDAVWPSLVRLFTPSGATLIQLDPDEPIPQKPERLAEFLSSRDP